MRKLFRLFLPAIIAIILSGCGTGSVNRKIEKAVLPKLPELIGPAEHYSVKADSSISGLANNKVDSLKITGVNALVAGKYPVQDLNIYMDDVKIDPETRAIKRVKSTRIEAVISEQQLLDYLQKKHPAYRISDISIGADRITIIGKPEYLGVSANVEAFGKLQISGPAKIDFLASRVKVGGVPAPDLLVQQALRVLNPVLNLEDWKFPIQLNSVNLLPGKVILNAALNLENGVPENFGSELNSRN